MNILLMAPILVFPALMIVAALKDATSFTIPNWISLVLIAAFPVAALAAGLPLSAIGWSLTAGLAGLAIGMVMFALRWMGGGDAKLLAAAFLWLGWSQAGLFVVATAVVGGLLALVLLLLRSNWTGLVAHRFPGWLQRLASPKEAMPYGIAIAAGGLAAFPGSAAALALAAIAS